MCGWANVKKGWVESMEIKYTYSSITSSSSCTFSIRVCALSRSLLISQYRDAATQDSGLEGAVCLRCSVRLGWEGEWVMSHVRSTHGNSPSRLSPSPLCFKVQSSETGIGLTKRYCLGPPHPGVGQSSDHDNQCNTCLVVAPEETWP